ncbi:MAG: 2-polyprenyl-3-methyl-5-hydroxy-6-metoxy-1,4-benzoquinol methylase [Planctomycetota bacterium]|jgi:2-polyprenyl-3-methyl-5-hydroxy-6-metoxy-1,4-benzoquinol methylase
MNDLDGAPALREAWLKAQGVSPLPVDLVHPNDDMARADVQKVPDGFELTAYARSGYEGFEVLRHVLRTAGKQLSSSSSLLDFAGGYGRILRYMPALLPVENIWCSDVLRPAVAFAQDTFGVNAFDSQTAPEDLVLPRKFDVIWVASLFSHLPRSSFAKFLARLYEALEPDGLLVFSTHTPEVLPEAERDASGFTFVCASESHVLDLGDYGSTFVDSTLVREICTEVGVANTYALERELWNIQDVYVVSPSAQPGLDNWSPAPIANGVILKAEVSETGHAWVGGYVRVPAHEAPVEEVALVLGENLAANRKTTILRPLDVALQLTEGGERFTQIDWYTEGPMPELLERSETLCAIVRLKSGAEWCFDATWLGR